MLQPKKNPLIDEPLIAASAGTFRRVKTTYWVLLGIISIIILTWLWLLKSFGEQVYTEAWWRLSISRLADWQFKKNVGLDPKHSCILKTLVLNHKNQLNNKEITKKLNKLCKSDYTTRQVSTSLNVRKLSKFLKKKE